MSAGRLFHKDAKGRGTRYPLPSKLSGKVMWAPWLWFRHSPGRTCIWCIV